MICLIMKNLLYHIQSFIEAITFVVSGCMINNICELNEDNSQSNFVSI